MSLTKEEDLKVNSELYEALMRGKDATVIEICQRLPKGPLHTLTIHEDTVLHMATYHKKNDLVLELLSMVPECEYHKLTWQNSGGSTILHETGVNNRTVEAAEMMLSMAPMLLSMTNKQGETALCYAARHGKSKIFKFLHSEVCKRFQGVDLKTFLRRDDKLTILHLAVLSRNYRIAHEIASTHKQLIHKKDADGMTALQHLASSSPEFHPKSIFKRMLFKLFVPYVEDTSKMFTWVKKLRKRKHSCEWVMKLAQLLIKNDTSWIKTESREDKRNPKVHQYGKTSSMTEQDPLAYGVDPHKVDTPLILATIHGCTEIVKEILTMYPQALEHIDKDGRNILHVAILYRRTKIIDDIINMKYPKDRLRGKIDNNMNTLLHMVGERVDELQDDLKNPAQILQDDALLFKKVEEDICTKLDAMKLNVDGKTPEQVFFENNDKLRSEAKEWMSDNAKNCSIVAVLIATVAYAAAYTIPGGYDKGHPVLKKKPMFLLFTIADAISLSSALTSVIIFLNIVTSTFQFKDFENNLFYKLNVGRVLLILSVAMMMVAFAATLILTISTGAKWTNMTLYGVSFFPVLVFVVLCVPEYNTLARSVYLPVKHMMKKLVLGVSKFWYPEPPPRHTTTRSTRFLARSPV